MTDRPRRSSRPLALDTPARITAAVLRVARTFSRAYSDAQATLGHDGAAWTALGSRVSALVESVRSNGLDPASPLFVQRLRLDLAHVQFHSARVHDVAVWLLAVASSIEGENGRAAALAVHLDSIVVESERITAAVQVNVERFVTVTAAA